MEPSEADRCRHAQLPAEAIRASLRRHHRFVGFLDRPLSALVEGLAGLGRDYTPRRTKQQAHAQPLLELDHGLRDGWLSDALAASYG
jgi:hypothetical protein